MQIKKRLQINVVMSVLTAFIICLVLFLALYRLNRANNSAKIAGDIIISALERVALRNDYVRNNSARAKEQWYAKHEQIGGLLTQASENFKDPKERQIVSRLVEDNESIGKIFMAIVENREKGGLNKGSPSLSREVEERLLNQLNMKVYEVVIDGRKLLQTTWEARDSAHRLAGGGVVSALAILVAAAMIGSWTMGRSITDRVARLREGAAIIGGGELEHRIDLKGDDEFAEVGEAFNAMTASLRSSQCALENEVRERKRTEESLREANMRYELVLTGSGAGIWDWEVLSHKVMFSHQWKSMRGFAEHEISDSEEEWSRMIHPEDAPRVMAAVQEHLEGITPFFSEEYRVARKDGSWMWINDRGLALRDTDGRVVRMAGSESDITERKLAEEALRESEHRLQQALLVSNSFTFEWKPATDQVLRSDSCATILHLFGNEVLHDTGQRYFQRVHPDDRERFVQILRDLTPATNSYATEYRVLRSDGSSVVLEEIAQAAFDAAGKLERVVGVTTDITERKRAEENLRESRAKLEAALASMTDAVFISDAEGRFIEFNDAFATFHRFRSKDECAKSFAEYPAILDLFMADGTLAPVEMWAVPRALRGETVTNAEYTLRRKDTGEYWIGSYSFAPICDADGKIVGSVVVGRDITDRKHAELTLQEAHGELVRLVEERTRELREKEVLLKEIHHRVKNNLQVISSLVGLQADGSKDETVRAGLRDVTDRVRSMALVHEKLYQSADLSHVDFAEYTRGLLGYLWRAHGAATVRLTLDLSPLSLPVDIAVPCGLILNELVGNALKHAFRGRSEGEVTVSLNGSIEGLIRLSVGDNGVGLPEGFDWRQTQSLGLHLVRLLSGQLDADVNVCGGEGTRFEVVFGNKPI
jgi:PAS domain S-box-containing protein